MVSWKQGCAKGNPLGVFWAPFWRNLVDLWCNFGAHLILKGFPKSTIFEKNRGLENPWFFDWFLMPKWEAWNCKKEVFASYLLQNMSLLGVVKHNENWCQKRSPKRLKSNTLAASGRIFEIFGGFRKSWFFEDFVIGKKLAPNLQKYDFKRAREISWTTFGRVGE